MSVTLERDTGPAVRRSLGRRRFHDEVLASMIRAGFRVLVTDTIDEYSPPAFALVAAPDLSSATFHAFGPFLSGTGTYTASSSKKNGRTTGTLSGNITARFDTPGPLSIANPAIPALLGTP
jgi:hypothetical protein